MNDLNDNSSADKFRSDLILGCFSSFNLPWKVGTENSPEALFYLNSRLLNKLFYNYLPVFSWILVVLYRTQAGITLCAFFIAHTFK